MSFEAVPCMFKSRQEDGNEAQLFGLLIRPAPAVATTQTQQQQQQQQQQLLPVVAGPSSSSSIQILPTTLSSDSAKNVLLPVKDGRAVSSSRCGGFNNNANSSNSLQKCPPSTAAASGGTVAGTATATIFSSGAPNGMPPILPRPKYGGKSVARSGQHQQQLMRSLVQLPPTSKAATLAFEMAQSPSSQVVVPSSAMGSAATISSSLESCGGDVLSVSTTTNNSPASSSSSSGCSSSSTPSLVPSSVVTVLASPAADSSASCLAQMNNNGLLLTVNHSSSLPKSQAAAAAGASSTGEKPLTTKAPRRRRSRPTLAQVAAATASQAVNGNNNSGAGSKSNGGTETEGTAGGVVDLLGDLHSIEYSQLVNSSVITTEDYLTSQSDPIYTNMDMYSTSLLLDANHRQQSDRPLEAAIGANEKNVQHHQQKKRSDADKNNAPSIASASAHSLCPSTIFIHNQQHHHQQQQHNFLNQHQQQCSSSSSSMPSSSVRFVPNGGPPPAAAAATAVVPSSTYQQHSTHWNPYMGAHPGGPSHISSTPDSGIQSIDGSPPSVYTPPMVSPYSSQVRSCESVNNGVHNGGMPSSTTICVANPSTSSNGATMSFYGGTSAYSSHTEESLTITALHPASSSMFLCASSSLNGLPPSLIIEQLLPDGDNAGGSGSGESNEEHHHQQQHHHHLHEDEAADFSDMPKLVAVTHTEHDEDVAEERDAEVRPVPGISSTADDINGKKAAPAQPLFHQGMSLHELAECLSSNISREQLKQLTALIQRKAEEQKNLEEEEGGGGRHGNRSRELSKEEKEAADDEQKQAQQRRHPHKQQQMVEEEEVEQENGGERGRSEQKKKEGKGGRSEERKRNTNTSEVKKNTPNGEERAKGDEEEEKNVGHEGRMDDREEDEEEENADQERKREEETQRERDARNIEQLAIYRARVREHLNRKLMALVDRVIKRMDECHLNISVAGGQAVPLLSSPRGWPWKKMNWDEVHRRAEAGAGRWMLSSETKMKNGRRGQKRKTEKGEEEEEETMEEKVGLRRRRRGDAEKKRKCSERNDKETKTTEMKTKRRKKEEGEDDQMKKRIGRKRKKGDTDEGTDKQTKKALEERREWNEKREELKKGQEERVEQNQKQEKKVREEGRERKEKREESVRELKKQTKKVRGEGRERREKQEESGREQKQSTPPIILRIKSLPSPAKTSALMTIKRATAAREPGGKSLECPLSAVGKRKPSSSPRPSCAAAAAASTLDTLLLRERSHSSATTAMSANDEANGRNGGIAIGGRRWTTTTGRRARGRGTPTATPGAMPTGTAEQQQHQQQTTRARRPWRRRRRWLSKDSLSDQERALAHSKHCFLIRNLCGRRPTGEAAAATAQSHHLSGPTVELIRILERTLSDFCALFNPPFVSDRQLDELIRTVKLMFSSVHDPSDLLTHFDSLLKQFISSSSLPYNTARNESVHAQFALLKQSIAFGNAKLSLQKDALSAFLDEGRNRSLSVPSVKRCGADSLLHRPLTVDTCIDLSYLDSAHPVGKWDPDKAAKLSPSTDNREHDCVRCICGIAEDDGVMSQCDRCHFWLHADCLDCPVLDDHKEFVCDFCTRRIATTPRVDIVLKPQPSIKLGGCTYYRTLVNSRGLQVRLNESVYVERLINDKHKSILRELHEECVRKQQLAHGVQQQSPQKRGRGNVGKRKNETGTEQRKSIAATAQDETAATTRSAANQWWPEQMTADGKTEGTHPSGDDDSDNGTNPCFHRRDLRVFRIERLFCSPNGQRFIFGCYYARPHETFCDSSRTFYRNELFWTPLFDTLPLDSVVGRCLVLEPHIWAMGRPKSPRYLEDDVFVCEYQIDRNQRSFEKIPPKNRYYINTEPYVFNVFEQKMTMRRDFTPFKVTVTNSGDNNKPSSSAAAAASTSSSSTRTDAVASSPPLLFNNNLIRHHILQQHLASVCSKIGAAPNS